jgi:hypothetical protein
VAVTALVSFLFALGPGHHIPFLGGTPDVGTGLTLLAAVIIVSTLVVVESHRLLTAGATYGCTARGAAVIPETSRHGRSSEETTRTIHGWLAKRVA